MPAKLNVLWTRVQDGNSVAWRELVHLYSDLVYSVAIRVGLSQPDAEDCAQQTWLSLFRKRKSIRDPKALPAWLITTTHRNAVALFRRLKSHSEPADFESLEDPGKLPDEELTRMEHQAILRAAMSQLDERCQRLLGELFFAADESSYAQLAKELKVNVNSIGSIRTRCLGKLKKTLIEMGFDAD